MISHLARRLAILALATAIGRAQPAPYIGFAYPAGGQQGTTFTVSVGGQNLNGATHALLSGGGGQLRVAGHERPLTQREINDLREEQQRLQDKRAAARADASKPAFTPEDEKRTNEIRQLLATRGNRQYTPAIAETITLEVTLEPDAAVGERELRVKTPAGWSKPLAFRVDQLPEKTPPVVTSTSVRTSRREPHLELALPALINGQILPGEVDRFRFAARQGQRLVFALSARALMPYLADAVPGWFQATLAILDARGRELAYVDDYRFAPDPVLACVIPADGTYTLEVKDALFRGREDFVYRIAAGELPFITSTFPLGGTAGRHLDVELAGWNLPSRALGIDATKQKRGLMSLSVLGQGVLSNPVAFELAAGPECLAVEPNDSPNDAQSIDLPVIVNGRLERPGDVDVFRFNGRAGATLVAEVTARRLGSPVDSVLTLLDERGQVLAANDDSEDKGTGLLTHHADSRLTFRLPADGTYWLRLADTQHQGGPEHGYRLRVSPPQPDFALRVVPSTINVRAGATVPLTIYALRRDGFSGEIQIVAQNAPSGMVLSGARIPAGQDSVRFTVTAPPTPREDTPALNLIGVANIADTRVARRAVPAEDMMQAFAYHHLVPAKELLVSIVGRGSTLRPSVKGPLVFGFGKEPVVRVAAPSLRGLRNLSFELLDAPAGMTVGKVHHSGDSAEIRLEWDPSKLKPGSEGNVILQAFGERATAAGGKAGQRAQRSPLGTMPAIPFKVQDETVPGS